ncbi:lipase family protein [Vibrio sp. TH_r3]|uniref:lipase family protein n=1 Tax=Vibrio sp. TH_r3 TaxID=3082084 RepID=UPI0029535DF8|nr:lipase family protein [Vibrio sp. TH_r3]MDV7104609.1 lipase family protein [Vibrio sp. TH_r3]
MDVYDHFTRLSGIEYDKETSLSLAVACLLAYQPDESEVKHVTERWEYQLIGVESAIKGKDIDTQCYVMENADNVVVVFRGTDSIEDWLGNFQAVYDPGPLNKTKAHEGFQDALFPAVIAITRMLEQPIRYSKKLWVTGHSLGGALASLYAGMLIEHGYAVHGIYTFASPRPGNGSFEAQLNSHVFGPHYRVVNSGDIVPHVPPEPFYSHPGSRIILKEIGIVDSKGSWFEQRIMALEKFVEKTANLFDVVDNHSLNGDEESYIPRLIRDLNR